MLLSISFGLGNRALAEAHQQFASPTTGQTRSFWVQYRLLSAHQFLVSTGKLHFGKASYSRAGD
jgi:hypothetical protein